MPIQRTEFKNKQTKINFLALHDMQRLNQTKTTNYDYDTDKP